MQDFIDRFKKILPPADRELLDTELRALGKVQRHRFRVGIVKPVSVNLSFVESLLGQEVMSRKFRRKLDVPIRIAYGKSTQVSAVTRQKSHDFSELNSDTWQKILTLDTDPTLITVDLPEENLRETRIELYDFPGFNDNEAGRPAVVKEIRKADMLVLLVDHSLLPGKTDLQYLYDLLKGHSVQVLTVIILGLDKVGKSEDTSVLEYVQQLLLKHKISNTLFAPVTSEISETAAKLVAGTSYNEIWQEIYQRSGNEKRHDRRIFSQLNELLLLVQNYHSGITTQLAAISSSQKEQKENSLTQRANIQLAEMNWDRIELDFNKTLQGHYDWINREVDRYAIKIKEVAGYGLKRTKDIRGWFEVELPHNVQSEISVMQNNLSTRLQQRLEMDFEQLERTVKTEFSIAYNAGKSPEFLLIHNEFPQVAVTDELLKDRKYITTVLITLAAIISIPFFGTLTAALGAGGGLLNELINKKAIQRQKEELLDRVHQVINRELAKMKQALKTEIEGSYDVFLKDLRGQADQWKQIQLRALTELSEDKKISVDDLQRRAKDVEELVETLTNQIENY